MNPTRADNRYPNMRFVTNIGTRTGKKIVTAALDTRDNGIGAYLMCMVENLGHALTGCVQESISGKGEFLRVVPFSRT
jgi:hypothetical protein